MILSLAAFSTVFQSYWVNEGTSEMIAIEKPEKNHYSDLIVYEYYTHVFEKLIGGVHSIFFSFSLCKI